MGLDAERVLDRAGLLRQRQRIEEVDLAARAPQRVGALAGGAGRALRPLAGSLGLVARFAKVRLDLRPRVRDLFDEAPVAVVAAAGRQPLLADHKQPDLAAPARAQDDVEMLDLRQVVRVLRVDGRAVEEEDVAFFKRVGIGHAKMNARGSVMFIAATVGVS